MNETEWTPVVLSASSDPSPAISRQSVTLKFVILDVFGVEGPETRLAGEFYSGEV